MFGSSSANKKKIFMVIIMYFFLIRIVSNAPKSFHFRFLCFFFSQQSFCFLSLQRQRIQSCEADTIPKPAIRNVQMSLTDQFLVGDMTSSYMTTLYTYSNPTSYSAGDCKFFTGASNFTPSDIEVFFEITN